MTHVDDLLYAGTSKFHSEVIREILKFFKISKMHDGTFVYLGLSVIQNKGFTTLDQRNYTKSIDPVEITLNRRKEPEDRLTENEQIQYQQKLGQLL